MDWGLTRYTKLEDPASSCRLFHKGYLETFLKRFSEFYEHRDPKSYDNAQLVALAVVANADRINYGKDKLFGIIPPWESEVLKMEGIYPDTTFKWDLRWENPQLNALALRINKELREEFPGSLLDMDELARRARFTFNVGNCIEYCIQKSERLMLPPYHRKTVGVR